MVTRKQRDKIQARREIEATDMSLEDMTPRTRSRETTLSQREREDGSVDTVWTTLDHAREPLKPRTEPRGQRKTS